MNVIKLLTGLFTRKPAAPPPKPWEDPSRSPADREAWIKAEPKSLKRNAA